MTYTDALAFLERTQALGIKLGLENIRALLDHLGAPQLSAPSVLVTGSNGKGSVASMMAACLMASGRRVGVYTSPHLVRPEERIAIDGRPLSAKRFAAVAGVVADTIATMLGEGTLARHPTYFECITAMAFVAFADARLDAVILEVGLGGRFDATNVADPAVSVITSIALEHTQYLGDTHAAIAAEKAAIARPQRPLISGVRSAAAATVIRDSARAIGARLVQASRFARTRIVTSSRSGIVLEATTPSGPYPRLRLALLGRHQERNAAVAITALEALPPALRPTPREVARGFRNTCWPGRLEYVASRSRILLDGAHNAHAARTLAAHLRELEANTPLVLVFTCMRDKDVRRLIAPLWRLFDRVVVTEVANVRCMLASELAGQWPRSSCEIAVQPDPASALEVAQEMAGAKGLVVVCGSLYLVGAVKALLAATRRRR